MKKGSVITGIALALLLSVLFSNISYAQAESFDLAKEAYKKGQWSNVVKHCKNVVDEHPDWFWGHYLMADAHLKLGQNDNAIRSANKALDGSEGNDDSFRARFVLASAYYKKGDFKNALSVIQKIKQRHTKSKYFAKAANEIYKMEGFSGFSLGNYKNSIASFKPLVDSGKASADVLRAVAKSHQEVGQNKASIDVISQVVRKDPKDISAHKILVKSYYNDKQYTKSIDSAKTAISSFPRDAELHYLKGTAHKGLEQYGSAESELRESLTLKNDDKTRRQLAEVLMSQGKFFEAAGEFGRAQGSFSNDANLFYKMAFSWSEFVPKDTEKYKGKQPDERNFFQALDNARVAIKRAAELGLSQDTVAAVNGVIDNKWDRLKKGETIEVEIEVEIDPETGEVIRREKVKGEK